MSSPLAVVEATGVVPAIAIEDAAQAIALADALLEGGLPVAEITFRTAAASEVLARISEARPEPTIGAAVRAARAAVVRARESRP